MYNTYFLILRIKFLFYLLLQFSSFFSFLKDLKLLGDLHIYLGNLHYAKGDAIQKFRVRRMHDEIDNAMKELAYAMENYERYTLIIININILFK